MALDPIFVSLYSAREGSWAWSVDFPLDGLSRTGVELGFAQAVRSILDAFETPRMSRPVALPDVDYCDFNGNPIFGPTP
jgi:hypothetical protein